MRKRRRWNVERLIKTCLTVGLVIYPALIPAAADTSRTSQNFRESAYGFSIESESHGSALGGFYWTQLTPMVRGVAQVKFLNVAQGLPVVDVWTGRIYEAGSANLLLVPMAGGITYHPFEGQIANNFSPLIAVGLGPVVILDLAEEGNFFDQWRNMETRIYAGAFAGFGVEIPVQVRSFMTVILGYDFLPMGKMVDGRRHYSGTVLKFMFGRRTRR